MTQVTFGDILDQIDDLCQNYSVSNIDLGNKKRAANRGIEAVQRALGLPSDKKIQSIYFYEDQLFYDATDGFNEMIQVYFNTQNANVNSDSNNFNNRWFVFKDIEILRDSQRTPNHNRAAYTSINGSNQLILKGRNVTPSLLINPFNTTSGLTFSTSITNATTDSNVYRYGGASVKFDMDNTESTSTITFTGLFDIRSFLNSNAKFRLEQFFPTGIDTTKISSLQLRLTSSTGNYYTTPAVTTDYNGDTWNTNAWNLLSFDIANATTTGSPDSTAITTIELIYNHGGSFANTSNFRVNNLYVITPDLLDVIYYSNIKGTDSTGVTDKTILTDRADIVAFGGFAPDLIMPIALKGALIVFPQLKGSSEFWSMYKSEYTDAMKLWSRTYPRQRSVNSGATQIIR